MSLRPTPEDRSMDLVQALDEETLQVRWCGAYTDWCSDLIGPALRRAVYAEARVAQLEAALREILRRADQWRDIAIEHPCADFENCEMCRDESACLKSIAAAHATLTDLLPSAPPA